MLHGCMNAQFEGSRHLKARAADDNFFVKKKWRRDQLEIKPMQTNAKPTKTNEHQCNTDAKTSTTNANQCKCIYIRVIRILLFFARYKVSWCNDDTQRGPGSLPLLKGLYTRAISPSRLSRTNNPITCFFCYLGHEQSKQVDLAISCRLPFSKHFQNIA